MATKKDLVEAYAFSRRRLVTAFVSGAPGGREVEPAKPGRTIIGGIALAVLLVAGAAIAGKLAPRTEVDWDTPGLVISKEKSQPYVILDDDGDGETVVRPVVNTTSAQLILGGEVEARVVPQEEISSRSPGDQIGILEAPPTPPDASDLVQSGWTSCTADGAGTMTTVTSSDHVTTAPGAALLVRADRRLFVIAEAADELGGDERAHAYRLPPGPTNDNLLSGIGAPVTAQAISVSSAWVSLFTPGLDLAASSFALPGLGEPVPYADRDDVPDDARVGDYVRTDNELLVLSREGPADISEFALQVLLNTPLPYEPQQLDISAPDLNRAPDSPYPDAMWPDDTRTPLTAPEACAQLVTAPGEVPRAHLAFDPDELATGAAVPRGGKEVEVGSGQGAVVRSGSWTDPVRGEPYLIDDRGEAYRLEGPGVGTALGYADVEPPVVDDAWLDLFGAGVALSVDAALCPPSRGERGTACR